MKNESFFKQEVLKKGMVVKMGVTLTSSEVLKELQLSRSTFYHLLKNNLITVPVNEKGRYIWDDALLQELKEKLSAYDAPLI